MNISLSEIYDEAIFRLRLLLGKGNLNKLIILMYHGVVRTPLQGYKWFVTESSLTLKRSANHTVIHEDN